MNGRKRERVAAQREQRRRMNEPDGFSPRRLVGIDWGGSGLQRVSIGRIDDNGVVWYPLNRQGDYVSSETVWNVSNGVVYHIAPHGDLLTTPPDISPHREIVDNSPMLSQPVDNSPMIGGAGSIAALIAKYPLGSRWQVDDVTFFKVTMRMGFSGWAMGYPMHDPARPIAGREVIGYSSDGIELETSDGEKKPLIVAWDELEKRLRPA